MTSDAKAPWMGDPLSIYKQQVRWLAQSFKCLYEHRCFAEGKQAWDVGELHGDLGPHLLYRLKLWIVKHDNGAPRWPGAFAADGDIGARYKLHVRRIAFADDLPGKTALDRYRLLR